eukprot:COSAG04_NODE_2655_length_3782_cov_7.891121_4_plen_186_part_00
MQLLKLCCPNIPPRLILSYSWPREKGQNGQKERAGRPPAAGRVVRVVLAAAGPFCLFSFLVGGLLRTDVPRLPAPPLEQPVDTTHYTPEQYFIFQKYFSYVQVVSGAAGHLYVLLELRHAAVLRAGAYNRSIHFWNQTSRNGPKRPETAVFGAFLNALIPGAAGWRPRRRRCPPGPGRRSTTSRG